MPLLSTPTTAPIGSSSCASRAASLRRAPRAALLTALLVMLGAGWSASSVSAATPPSATTLPTVAGIGQVGETLTADDGTFVGNPDPTISRHWERCDATGGSCEPIGSETESTYVVDEEDVGGTLRVAVTATSTDDLDPWISSIPLPRAEQDAPRLAEDTTNNTWTVTVRSDPFAVPAPPTERIPKPVADVPATDLATPAVPARTILRLAQPREQCTTLARLVQPGTPGTLVATGALDGTVTIRAAAREVLRVTTSAGTVDIQAGKRALARADDVGALGWTERSRQRVTLQSSDGRLLIAVGRNAHHPTRTVIKSRLCTTLAPALGHLEGRADHALHATVYATGEDGTPIAFLPLTAAAGATNLRLVTDAHGRALIWLPAGGRRDLHVNFAGDATHAAAELGVPLISAATSTLTLVSGVLPARAPAEFAGRLAGRDGNAAGSRITLRYRTADGTWRTVGRGLADERGHWTITTAPPRQVVGRPVAAYRVLVEPGPTYPYRAALGPLTTFHVTRGATR